MTVQAKLKPDRLQGPPNFVPKWMFPPQRWENSFNHKRALSSAIRIGDLTLIRKLVDHYEMKEVSLDDAIRTAHLNKKLVGAVDELDVEQVRLLLDQGANPNAASWNYPRGKWFPVLLSAVIVSRSSQHSPQNRQNAHTIIGLLEQHGGSLPFWDDPRNDF
ncbi:hypothetical protein KKB44_04515 [Candidatus Micrarchaeota archaeon]|nr:hypothetical protein [Candidatus Micrarchaeota archaeon]